VNRVRKQIHYSRAEKEQLTGYHIGVGVLDSGIFPHEDLKDQIRAFRDFTNKYQLPYDETGHGTHVCGILETDVSCTGNIKAWHHAVICMSGKY